MIRITLDVLAKRLGKTITDIALDTGINRNTITALYHNKVDGVKFSTLEKICSIYKVELFDLIEMAQPTQITGPRKLYKQEGSIVPFTCWPWVIAINNPDPHWFSVNFSTITTYYKEDYGMGYWDLHNLNEVARSAYHRYSNPEEYQKLYAAYLLPAKSIEETYLSIDERAFLTSSPNQINALMQRVWNYYEKFWATSLFIDSFDAGFDQEEINRIATKYHLSVEEISVLTTPIQPTFNNDRQLELLMLIRSFIKKKQIRKEMTREKLERVLGSAASVQKYSKKYDYYKSTYAQVKHITLDEIVDEVEKYVNDSSLLESEYKRLLSYSDEQQKKVKKVLKSHNLKKNPLEFFAQLTYWREHRKQVNLMGIHLLDMILRAVELVSGIPYKYLQYLSYEEVEGAMKGLVTAEMLQKRRENGGVVICEKGSYKIIEGAEAASIQQELEQMLHSDGVSTMDLRGNVASQGYAKGIARVIMDQNDFHKFNEGEILVTGMTRPEFVPLMKKAAGIVTNEGGITCHAAIVSRELGKPCIIGTKQATQVIKDGDLVEVRANHGTVRILSE